MALDIPLAGIVRWYIPGDPDIAEPATGLGHDYKPAKVKDGGRAAYLDIQQLSDAAFSYVQRLYIENDMSPDFVEAAIRYGVVGWGNLTKGGEPIPEPKFTEGAFGKMLAKESYDAIVPFLARDIAILAVQLFLMSQPSSS